MLYSLSRKEGWRRYVEAPARQRPAQLLPGQLKRLGGAAREQYDEARHDWHANFGILRTPQLAAVHDELELIVAAGRQDPDRVRGAAVIDALPGLGKTTAANSFARGFDRDQIRRHGPLTGQGCERIPVFRVGLTSNTTLRTLNRMICEFYGHPGAGRASAAQLASQAVDCVLSCESRVGCPFTGVGGHGVYPVAVPVPGSGSGARGRVQHGAGPIGTVTVASRARGEETWKVTQAGPVTMTPPVKPVKRGPHTGSRTVFREAARRAWPDRVLNNSPMRDGEPYTSLAPAGRVMETVAKGAADAETARKAL